jgi:acyl dehydratase
MPPRSFLFPIDASLLLQFSRAIGDRDPRLEDPRFVELARGGSFVPPPTFVIAAEHFDPQSRFRPEPGEAFPGSGRITDDWRSPGGRGGGLHGEEIFEYHRHPRAGEILTVDVAPGATWEKEGRNGTLRFSETVSTYRDEDDAVAVVARWVSVATERRDPGSPSGAGTDRPSQPVVAPAPSPPPPPVPLHAKDLHVGDSWGDVVMDQLTLSHLVRYAGASGDFIGLHHDARIARIVGGYPDVFAHGMLTMGLSGRVLSAVVGTETLTRFSARMVALVVPGDRLTTVVAVESIQSDPGAPTTVELRLTTTNDRGVTVLSGSATAALSE